jgi:hypothetical protein
MAPSPRCGGRQGWGEEATLDKGVLFCSQAAILRIEARAMLMGTQYHSGLIIYQVHIMSEVSYASY